MSIADELARVISPHVDQFERRRAERVLGFLRAYLQRPEVVERAGRAFERHFDPHNDGTITEATGAALAAAMKQEG